MPAHNRLVEELLRELDGHRITVTRTDGKAISGTLSHHSDEALELTGKSDAPRLLIFLAHIAAIHAEAPIRAWVWA